LPVAVTVTSSSPVGVSLVGVTSTYPPPFMGVANAKPAFLTGVAKHMSRRSCSATLKQGQVTVWSDVQIPTIPGEAKTLINKTKLHDSCQKFRKLSGSGFLRNFE